MRFLQTHPRGLGSAYELLSIEGELQRRGFLPVSRGNFLSIEAAARAAGKLGLNRLLYPFRNSSSGKPVLVAHGGVPDSLTFPLSLWTRFIPWSFDCWPPDWPRWESFYRHNDTHLAFLTARQCVEHFQSRLPERMHGRRFLWLPEWIDPALYRSGRPLADRRIDVLELGRRYQSFHAAVEPLLSAQHAVHRYEMVKGTVIFSERESLVEAYSDTKISVCFPSSLTHPERSGSVETLTLRYLESIASRTLIVGKCPAELADLFGYNPVIELSDPRQIIDLLPAISTYQSLVERNYQRLVEVGTHTVRVKQLVEALRAQGLSAPGL